MTKSSLACTVGTVLALIVISSQSANAYIDPGTGSR